MSKAMLCPSKTASLSSAALTYSWASVRWTSAWSSVATAIDTHTKGGARQVAVMRQVSVSSARYTGLGLSLTAD